MRTLRWRLSCRWARGRTGAECGWITRAASCARTVGRDLLTMPHLPPQHSPLTTLPPTLYPPTSYLLPLAITRLTPLHHTHCLSARRAIFTGHFARPLYLRTAWVNTRRSGRVRSRYFRYNWAHCASLYNGSWFRLRSAVRDCAGPPDSCCTGLTPRFF